MCAHHSAAVVSWEPSPSGARHTSLRSSASPAADGLLNEGSGEYRQNSLLTFYKRFSGPVRAMPPEHAGADAWRATTYRHGVLQTPARLGSESDVCPVALPVAQHHHSFPVREVTVVRSRNDKLRESRRLSE